MSRPRPAHERKIACQYSVDRKSARCWLTCEPLGAFWNEEHRKEGYKADSRVDADDRWRAHNDAQRLLEELAEHRTYGHRSGHEAAELRLGQLADERQGDGLTEARGQAEEEVDQVEPGVLGEAHHYPENGHQECCDEHE